MAVKRRRTIPAPPSANASGKVKAAYYRKHDLVDLIDAGHFEGDGLYLGDCRASPTHRRQRCRRSNNQHGSRN